MKLQHHITNTILAITFTTTALPAATIPNLKAVPMSVKAPVVHVITTPKVPAVKVPAVPKIPNTPKIPVVKTPSAPKVPMVRIPSPPKIPVVKVPVIPRIVSAPKVPSVKVPSAPKIPAIATPIRTPQPLKVPQVLSKIPAIAQTRPLISSKRTVKVPATPAAPTPVIKTVTPVKLRGSFKPVVTVQTTKAASLGRELTASGIVAGKKDFVARRVGEFSNVNAPRNVVPDSDSDAQEMAVIPPSNGSGSAGQNTDPATAAGEMGWTPWWAAGSTGEYTEPVDPYQIRVQPGSAPRDPTKKLLYAPNPVKSGSSSATTQKKK